MSTLAKRVSNYELFFDLAFVLAIGRLNSQFHHTSDFSLASFLSFLTTNMVLLTVWGNEVYFFNKYGDARRIDIYTIIGLMFLIGNLSLSFNFDTDAITRTQFLTYNGLLILIHGVIALQHVLKGRILGFDADIKHGIRHSLLAAAAIVPLFLGLLPINPLTLLGLYLLPLYLPAVYPPTGGEHRVNFPHLVERNQLLIILTFGEAVIAIISNYPLTEYPLTGALFFLGMSFMFMLYMAQTFLNIDHHRRTFGALLVYAHMLLVLAINLLTLSMEFLKDSHHQQLGLVFLALAISLFFIGLTLTSRYNKAPYFFEKSLLIQWSASYLLFLALLVLARDNLFLIALGFAGLGRLLGWIYFRNRRSQRERHNIPHPNTREKFLSEIRQFHQDRT